MKEATNNTGQDTSSSQGIPLNAEDLVARIQKGDEGSFEVLYSHFYPLVHKRVWHMVPENDVDDVTQNVFIAVIKSLSSFRGDARFTTWLFTITSRQVANYYRKGERSPKQADKDIGEYQDQLPQNPGRKSASNIEDLITLRRGLAELPEDYQAIILMRLVEGYRFKEIAKEFGKSLDAVKSLFRRAVAALRDKMEMAYD